jgi:hypothetical protein
LSHVPPIPPSAWLALDVCVGRQRKVAHSDGLSWMVNMMVVDGGRWLARVVRTALYIEAAGR